LEEKGLTGDWLKKDPEHAELGLVKIADTNLIFQAAGEKKIRNTRGLVKITLLYSYCRRFSGKRFRTRGAWWSNDTVLVHVLQAAGGKNIHNTDGAVFCLQAVVRKRARP
jgi:hypothetical protein